MMTQTNDMTNLLLIALILSVCVSLITLVSRHRLSVRHKQAKATLNRVSGERDTARWELLRLKDKPGGPEADTAGTMEKVV
jgi:hypothetical protein